MGVACTSQHLAILLYSKCGHLLRVTWRVGRGGEGEGVCRVVGAGGRKQ